MTENWRVPVVTTWGSLTLNDEISFIKKLDAIRQKTGLNTEEIASITTFFYIKKKYGSYGISSRTIERFFELDENMNMNLAQRENIAYILAVFFALDLMSLGDVKNFFLEHKIANPLVESPDSLWVILKEGKKRYQSDNESMQHEQPLNEHKLQELEFEANLTASLSTKNTHYTEQIGLDSAIKNTTEPDDNKVSNRKKNIITLIATAFIITIGIIFAIFLANSYDDVESQLSSDGNMTNTNNDNARPVTTCISYPQSDDPIFLPDQGFSQFRVNELAIIELLSNEIRSIAINPDGVWVGYMAGNVDGVSRYDGVSWYHCRGLNIGAGNTNDFVFTDDAVLVAIDRLGIARLDSSGWHVYDLVGVDTAVYRFFSDGSDIWISTYGGVAKLVENNWQVVHQSDPAGLYNNRVFSYWIDSQGFEWFGLLSDGISRYSPLTRQWDRQFIDDIPLQNIRGIVEREQDGSIWFASSGQGVARYYNDQWTLFDTNNSSLISNSIEDIEVDKFGRVWVATPSGVAYTPDDGVTWIQHSTMPSLDIEFGCQGCPDPYNDNHIWIVLSEGNGLGHARIPPEHETIRILNAPQSVQLMPNEPYVFSIAVEVIGEELSYDHGDVLYISDPIETELFRTVDFFPMRIDETRTIGLDYIFHNTDNPLIAPAEPGSYTLHLRVWQGSRYVTESIVIEIEVH